MPADIARDCSQVIPIFLAAIPRAKDTAKYPRQMGTPAASPFLNHLPFVIVSLIFSLSLFLLRAVRAPTGLRTGQESSSARFGSAAAVRSFGPSMSAAA